MMRQARHASLLLLIFFGALSGRAFGLNWGGGLSGMGASLSDTANALMQQELQRQMLERQHQQQMQEIQAQHDLQMQQLQEQHRLFLEQQQQFEADRQRAEQERQKQRMAAAAKSKAIDAAQMAHLVKTYPDWRAIVGAVDISKQHPDPNSPFRKWLAGKPAEYQAKINGTNSPREIEKAIALFRTEGGGPSAPKPAAAAPGGVNDWITKPKLLSDADVGFKPEPAGAGPWTQYAPQTQAGTAAKSSGGFDPNRPYEMGAAPAGSRPSGGISFEDLIPKGR